MRLDVVSRGGKKNGLPKGFRRVEEWGGWGGARDKKRS